MPNDNKDRLGQKLQDAEAAQEDQWARKRDAELLEKMRKRTASMTCPHCKRTLVESTQHGVPMWACPGGEGAWLDAQSLLNLVDKGRK